MISESLLAAGIFSVLFAFFVVQVGGLVHDSGHRAIFKSAKNNDILGFLGSFLIATAYTNWKKRHNLHHAETNLENDPDINVPFLCFTSERFSSKRGFEKFISTYQTYMYFPILFLIPIAERYDALLYFTKRMNRKYILEMIIFMVGASAWFFLPFFIFDFTKALVVVLIYNAVSGFYLGNIFAPNHKGMIELKKSSAISFLEHQIITTRNIRPNPLTDFIYLGLNYQIEHHLFPNCPRNKLGQVTSYVKDVCSNVGLEFTETSIIESNKIILRELHRIANTAGTLK